MDTSEELALSDDGCQALTTTRPATIRVILWQHMGRLVNERSVML